MPVETPTLLLGYHTAFVEPNLSVELMDGGSVRVVIGQGIGQLTKRVQFHIPPESDTKVDEGFTNRGMAEVRMLCRQ